MLIKEKKIQIQDMDSVTRTYKISRVPAVHGRKIFTQYITSAAPKLGDYDTNQELMQLLLSYVEAQMPNGNFIQLTTQGLIDAHVPDWETLVKLEKSMVVYNTNFFQPEKISKALESLGETLPQKIMSTLTLYLGQLSQQTKQPGTNSGQSTTTKTR